MKALISIIIVLTFFGCKEKVAGIDSGHNPNKYPLKQGYQWEYSSFMSREFLNTHGGTDSIQSIDIPNTIVRVSSVNDSLPGFNNLINIESYNADTPGQISEDWYLNSDSVFSIIAYRNPGSSYPIIPKKTVKKYLTTEDFEKIAGNLTFNTLIYNGIDDSVQYYQYPRIVLQYPLYVGSEWNELKAPFYRDRTVKGMTSVTLSGSSYNCYIIESYTEQFKVKMVDYISLQAGLVKREIISDSVAIVSADSPDSAIGYVRGHDVSILVNKNF